MILASHQTGQPENICNIYILRCNTRRGALHLLIYRAVEVQWRPKKSEWSQVTPSFLQFVTRSPEAPQEKLRKFNHWGR